jgi:hypothetical protein
MGLDLKKLEEKVNKALNNETVESLSEWLYTERFGNNAKSYVGGSVIEEISVSTLDTRIDSDDSETKWVSVKLNNITSSKGTNNYALAA